MKKNNTPCMLRGAMLLVALAFTTMAPAQTGGKNQGRSNSSGGCCRIAWRPVLPPGTFVSGSGSPQERRAAPETLPLFNGNEREGKIDVTVLNAAGQAQDPSKWSLSKEGETMLVDISKLPKESYTIQMLTGKSIEEWEVGTDGAAPRLASSWDKIEVLEGLISCYPSHVVATNCDGCPSSDTECDVNGGGWWRRQITGSNGSAQSRIAAPAPPKIDAKKLTAIVKTCSPGESTFFVCQCGSGELKKISKMSECPAGCYFYTFERKKR